MNGEICINEVPVDEYVKEKQRYKLNPLLEPFWIESFRDDSKTPVYYVFRNQNKTVGLAAGLCITLGLPIFRKVSKYLYIHALPLIDYHDSQLVIQSFKHVLKQNGFNRLNIGSFNSLQHYGLKECGFKIRHRYEYFINLSLPLDTLWRQLSKGQKWSINRAKRTGLRFDIDHGRHKLDELIECLEQTRLHKTSKGFGNYHYFCLPFMTRTLVNRILDTDNAFICTVYDNNKVLSSSLIVITSAYWCYMLAGSTEDGYKLNANSYLLWRIIEAAKEAGCEVLNLGGLPLDETAIKLAQFKRSFGAEKRLCETGICDLQQGLRRSLHKMYIIPALFLSMLMYSHR